MLPVSSSPNAKVSYLQHFSRTLSPHTRLNTSKGSNQIIERAAVMKDSSYGWIGSFATPGCPESGGMASYRPKIGVGECVDYSVDLPTNHFIGLDWGAGSYSFKLMCMYDMKACGGTLIHIVDRRKADWGACWDAYANGSIVASVKVSPDFTTFPDRARPCG